MMDGINISFDQKEEFVSVDTLIADYLPPNQLIEDLFNKGYLYGATGLTGSGKTAVALYLALCVARGARLGERKTEQGRVLYLAGENCDDVTRRFVAMLDGEDLPPIDVVTVAGREGAERCISKHVVSITHMLWWWLTPRLHISPVTMKTPTCKHGSTPNGCALYQRVFPPIQLFSSVLILQKTLVRMHWCRVVVARSSTSWTATLLA
jgi:hypothetical protein